jgi:DNA-binding NarL/FixJ family response regulator
VRALIADDSVLVREGIARLLERSDIEVVAQAGDYDDVLRKARAHKPDVAVVDIRMPPDHSDEGIRAARAIRGELPGSGVLVLSQHLEAAYALELLSDGSDGLGYLLKDRVTEPAAFVDAVRRVAGGGSALDPEVVQELLGRRRADDPLDRLTPRERDVMALMAEGLTNAGIAERLVVTEKAVERHVTAIFGKLLLDAAPTDHRRVLAVLKFLESA